jgi:hypothetical protein
MYVMKNLFLFFTLAILLSGCKKKDATPEEEVPVVVPPANTDLQSGLGMHTAKMHGMMIANSLVSAQFTINLTSFVGSFNSVPQPFSYYYKPEGTALLGVYAGTLKLDTNTLQFNENQGSGDGAYYNNIYDTNPPLHWDLTATSPFTSFNVEVKRGYPLLTEKNFLPAIVTRSLGLTVNLSGIYTNTDSLIFSFSNSSTYIWRRMSGNSTSVHFSPEELASFEAGKAEIYTVAYNYSNKTVNNFHYIFMNTLSLSQQVDLK